MQTMERRPILIKQFGEVFRETRKKAGLTMQDIASHLGVTVPYVSDVENGNRSPFVPERIIKAAELLKVDPTGLLEAAAKTRGSFDLDLHGLSDRAVQVGAALQRGWPDLSDDVREKIGVLIRGGK